MKRLLALLVVFGTVVIFALPSRNAGASALTNKTVCGTVLRGSAGQSGASVFILNQTTGEQGGTTTGSGGVWCASFFVGNTYSAQATYYLNCFRYQSGVATKAITSTTTGFPTMNLNNSITRICSASG